MAINRISAFAALSLLLVPAHALFAAGQDPSANQIRDALTPTDDALTPTAKDLNSHRSRGTGFEPADEPDAKAPVRVHHTLLTRRADAAEGQGCSHTVTATDTQSGLAGCDLFVQFASNSASLTPAASRTLDRLGQALTSPQLAAYHFKIEGHTDTVGPDESNQTLSEQRAQTVAAYLESHFNIAAERLQPVGVGKAGLAVPTADQVNEPRNRRVAVITLGG
jgi:outer membrane protein OmpA-like peptidoglycan-associated protein